MDNLRILTFFGETVSSVLLDVFHPRELQYLKKFVNVSRWPHMNNLHIVMWILLSKVYCTPRNSNFVVSSEKVFEISFGNRNDGQCFENTCSVTTTRCSETSLLSSVLMEDSYRKYTSIGLWCHGIRGPPGRCHGKKRRPEREVLNATCFQVSTSHISLFPLKAFNSFVSSKMPKNDSKNMPTCREEARPLFSLATFCCQVTLWTDRGK